jgi:hypothetical protein
LPITNGIAFRQRGAEKIICPYRAFLLHGGLMGNLKLGANTTVFLVFFGISLLDAIVSRRWLNVVLWAAFGALFIRADNRKTAAQ